jgi:hypothetical protein
MFKKIITTCLFTAAIATAFSQNIKAIIKQIPTVDPKNQVQIVFLGSTHFGQQGFFKDAPKADLFTEQRQKEVEEINQLLLTYNPDMIMIETTPEEQSTVDSLYGLYKQNKLDFKNLSYGRAEQYQFGYKLARQLGLNRVYGVDYYESVSNRILTNGDNINYYQDALTVVNKIVGEVDKGFKEGDLSLKAYLKFLNEPAILDYAYRLFYLTPAKVRNGKFVQPPVEFVDTAYINNKYIGAEFVSIFYERELKIYSNIITTQLRQKGKRLLVIMGQRHAASLPKIFANDPAYKVIPLNKYIK